MKSGVWRISYLIEERAPFNRKRGASRMRSASGRGRGAAAPGLTSYQIARAQMVLRRAELEPPRLFVLDGMPSGHGPAHQYPAVTTAGYYNLVILFGGLSRYFRSTAPT
jgi:hypothetical protein